MGQKCDFACPIHMSNSHTKFGLILSNSLGGDSVADVRMEAIAISPLLLFLKRRYNNGLTIIT